jgi:hypothetical protein
MNSQLSGRTGRLSGRGEQPSAEKNSKDLQLKTVERGWRCQKFSHSVRSDMPKAPGEGDYADLLSPDALELNQAPHRVTR